MKIENKKINEDYLLENVIENEFLLRKTLFQENIHFINCNFSKITIEKIKVKGSITFNGCSFENDVSLIGIQTKESINFHNCEFHKSLSLFDINVAADLNWFNTTITGDLNLDSIHTIDFIAQKLEVRNVQFYHSTFSTIKKILFKDCDVSKKISLVNIKQLENIGLENLNVSSIIEIDRIDLLEPVSVNLKNVFSSFLKIHNFKNDKKTEFDILECTFDKVQITNIELQKGHIDFKNTYVSGSIKITSINTNDSYINIEDLVFGELILDRHLIDFINNRDSNSPLFIKEGGDFNQKIKTLNNLKKMFISIGDFQTFDNAHYLLKNYEYKSRIMSEKQLTFKAISFIKYFIGKYIFGWGVRLQSILVSLFLIILLYGSLFLATMYSNEKYTFTLNGELYNSAITPIQLSLFYFTGFFGDINATFINNSIGLSEHIIGILYFTLVIGVILRKLFR